MARDGTDLAATMLGAFTVRLRGVALRRYCCRASRDVTRLLSPPT